MKTMQKVWIRKGIVFVPHREKPKRWVGPGYGFSNLKDYTETNMRALNAIDSMRLLFPFTEVK